MEFCPRTFSRPYSSSKSEVRALKLFLKVLVNSALKSTLRFFFFFFEMSNVTVVKEVLSFDMEI